MLSFTYQGPTGKGEELPDKKFQLCSNVFKDGADIPVLYSSTHRGENISPPLFWSNPPPKTKSFALIAIDLDIPFRLFTFTHWVIYNIPADKQELPAGIPHQTALPDGSIQGKNGYCQNCYLGPNPIWGKHRYQFTIYALDTTIASNPSVNKKRLLKIIEKHTLGMLNLPADLKKYDFILNCSSLLHLNPKSPKLFRNLPA